jgi:hypothetical protein
MRIMDMPRQPRNHHGVVLDISPQGFDKGAATCGSLFKDEEDPNNLLLFYTGAQDTNWSHSAIGLAISRDGLKFTKASGSPIFEGIPGSFCAREAMTPVVTRIKNKFYMIFSGKASSKESRRLGIAYADDPTGPWRLIGELIRPRSMWEGHDIDIGPSVVRPDDETVLVFYSSLTSVRMLDLATFLRGYVVRRIGILKVRIRGTSISSIEALRFAGNPLKHLNGTKGSWNESVFCPGHMELNGMHYLFSAASTYSIGFPYRQFIGMLTSRSAYFQKNASPLYKLIDGPKEKSQIIPNIQREIALDSPAPYFDANKSELFLYYSVADRANEVWKIALTTFDLDMTTR